MVQKGNKIIWLLVLSLVYRFTGQGFYIFFDDSTESLLLAYMTFASVHMLIMGLIGIILAFSIKTIWKRCITMIFFVSWLLIECMGLLADITRL